MLRTTSKKGTKKSQPRKKTSANNKPKSVVKEQEVEVESQDVILNNIMEPEDIEAEMILNDLVPERDKAKYGIKSNNTKSKKGGLNLNLNFMSNSKKTNKKSKTTKNNKQRSSAEHVDKVVEENTNDDLNKTEE